MNRTSLLAIVGGVALLGCCFGICSCRRAVESTAATPPSASTKTTMLEKVSATGSGTTEKETAKDWHIAYNKAVDLNNQGKLTDASYYFSNALGMSPGNITVIGAYCNVMLSLSNREGQADHVLYDITLLQIVEGFLQSQIPLVGTNDVEAVLAMLADVRTRMDAAGNIVAKDNPLFEATLKNVENGEYILPTKSPEEIASELIRLGDLREYASAKKKDAALLQKLNSLSTEAENALEFHAISAILQGRKSTVRASMSPSPTIATYQLQECEQCLRQMIALPSSAFTSHIAQEFKELEKLAQEVAAIKGAEEWRKLVGELNNIKKEREAITYGQGSKGKCQAQMECLQKELALLQNTLPMLTGEGNSKLATERLQSLTEEAVRIGNLQSQEYNAWAIGKIKKCLGRAKGGVGHFVNGAEGRKAIGLALIEELGPIDRRFLTSEVSRSFEEVLNKYLAPNQLDPVKDENDLTKEGTILHTLNQMYETEKSPLFKF